MKAVAFDYQRAADVGDAIRLLGEAGGEGRLLAGGQSLGPMLNLRLARPGLLIDIRRLEALRGVEEGAESLAYGAAVTHAEIEDGKVPDAAGGLLRHVAGGIAYRAVRNRGTLGGSLAHADPAADWLSTLVALDARLRLQAPGGVRSLPLAEAVVGAFATALAEDEVLTAVEVPKLSPAARWGFHKINRKTGEFADAIGVVVADPERGLCRVVAGAVEGPPVLLGTVAEALAAEGAEAGLAAVEGAVAAALPQLDAIERHLHGVALRRAIAQVYAP